MMFTEEQVQAAINRACNDIIKAADLPETGTVDALNLLVNASLCYLRGDADDLEGAAAASYSFTNEEEEEVSSPLQVVLEWIDS